ncbi:two-component system sensor kinase [Pseudonocardia sp. Ae168_Ps1]|uniref:sensor histidine kinase n=1 Tax=unclassified Pseudonocardia TaxID=2619320 RepID=UPI00095E1A40|nr:MULTISPECIES: ATP-binding protein [unclassified Pseudonocardia]OLL72441.1 two-component system sensor kinase [Pseudonocardia sp. Ae150A_Ps1]OLL78413.1 two-component system sensor kinase [Pseudonocardia sp. Ae168_Ps1]OLL87461.1 two-component system sensor kinase [Pseudonocardia sp. Ae263_Ps1]OLL92510.1 two-component system sensor kinase [Pseudonocardia sp. Ae356_Ps1]
MSRTGPHPVRRALLGHVLGTVAAAALVCALVTAGVWWLAHDEAERRAEQVSRRVAAAVVVPLADRDLAAAGPAARDRLLADLAPFRTVGMVSRVKIWLVEGPSARVVFSDEPRLEGFTRRFDPDLAARLDGGAAVVLAVPDDPEHRFEQGGGLREVFLGFTDAAGRPARVEVYVPVDVEGSTARAVGLLVPPVVGGLLAVALAVLPLSVALARRRERERIERRDAARYGLAAGELARRDLARRLHDDVLPGLASAGLMLDLAPARPELVSRARKTVGDGVLRIRSVLDDLLPADVDAAGLPDALHRLAAGGEPRASVAVPGAAGLPDATAVLLHRIAGELLRNVRAHAAASTVGVDLAVGDGRARLTVTDDGTGFDPGRGPEPGHIGLLLVRDAARDAGGEVTVRSAPGSGTTVTVDLPDGR